MSQPEITKLSETVSDITMAMKRAKKLHDGGALDIKKELVDNVYPLMRKLAMSAAAQESIDELGAELDELLEQEGSTITPELGRVLVGFVNLTATLIDGVRSARLDDVTSKKLEAICQELDRASPYILNEVNAATVVADEEEGDEQDGEPDGEDEDGEPEAANDDQVVEKPENG